MVTIFIILLNIYMYLAEFFFLFLMIIQLQGFNYFSARPERITVLKISLVYAGAV